MRPRTPRAAPETVSVETPPSEAAAGAFVEDWKDTSRYALISEIARGGGGRIAIAIDRKLGRRVALKRALDADGESRLEREALVLARLEHPAIVPIHDAGYDPEGAPYYTMKLLAGQDLAKRIEAATTFDQRVALLPAITTVADAMAYAHGQHVIHRDLKPGNVLVGDFGEVAVIDWGLGKVIGDAEPTSRATPLPGPQLTVAGAVMGTPAYMAPEQAETAAVDARADVYALGAMLYHVLTGTVPYGDVDTTTTLARLIEGPPAPIESREPRVPGELAAIIHQAMARDPGKRYPTAKELAEDLHRYQTGRLVAAHRYRIWTRVWKAARRHRAKLAIAAGVAGVAVATLAIAFGGGEVDETCVGVDAPVRAVWSPAVRAAAEHAFAATGLPFATSTWTRVATAVDRQATEIGAMRIAACRATRVTKDQPEAVLATRMQCLDRRTSELGALATVLAHADPGAVEKADQALGSLSRVADCADLERLRDLVPLPADPARRTEVLAVEAELDRFDALDHFASPTGWMTSAPALATRAEATAYPPAIARARILAAQALISMGKDDPASDQLRIAIAAAERSHDDADRAHALIQLLRIEVDHRQRPPVAALLTDLALAAAERANDPNMQTSVYIYRGQLELVSHKTAEAVADGERALALQRASGGAMLVSVERALAELYIGAGRQADAEALFHGVIDRLTARYGTEDFPDTAAAWGGLANVAYAQGNFAKAVELEQHEVDIDGRLRKTNADDWISARQNLAVMKRMAGRNPEAEAELVATLVDADALGKTPATVDLAYNLAIVRDASNELDGAVLAYRDTIARGEAIDPDLPLIATAHAELGDVYRRLDKPALALPELTAALAVMDQKGEPLNRGVYRVTLAQVLWALGKKDEAKATAATARAWLVKAGDAGKESFDELDAWEKERR